MQSFHVHFPRSRAWHALVLVGALAVPLALRAQTAPALVVHGAAGDSVVLSAAQLSRLPRVEVQATEHGRTGRFAGVALQAALAAAGVRVDSLRGPALADVAIVEAADGYRVVFSLGELAGDLGGRAVLLADHRDGAPLAGSEGPLRLVVATDGRPTRWVRQVRAVTIRRVAP